MLPAHCKFASIHLGKIYLYHHARVVSRDCAREQRAWPVESQNPEASGLYQPCQGGEHGKIVIHNQDRCAAVSRQSVRLSSGRPSAFREPILLKDHTAANWRHFS
jgi:hypothetical protein